MKTKKKKPQIKKVRIKKVQKLAPDEHLIDVELVVKDAPEPPFVPDAPIEIVPSKELTDNAFSIWDWLRNKVL
jgi:hypothetical protein